MIKMRRFSGVILATLFFCLNGCGFHALIKLEPKWEPVKNAGVNARIFLEELKDDRSDAFLDRKGATAHQIGEERNEFGAVDRRVFLEHEPALIITDAVEKMLEEAGYQVVMEGAIKADFMFVISGTLREFEVNDRVHNFVGGNAATIVVELRLTRDGKVALEKTFKALNRANHKPFSMDIPVIDSVKRSADQVLGEMADFIESKAFRSVISGKLVSGPSQDAGEAETEE